MELHSRAPRSKGLILAGQLFSLGLLLLPAAGAQSVTPAATLPSPGQWFEFDYNIYLDNGIGNYSGYTEQTLEHYRYTVVSVVGANVTMYGTGAWHFSNSTGSSRSGSWNETFSFSTDTRKYLWGFDVIGNYQNPVVWFWSPTPLSVGERVSILDDNFTVRSLSSDVWGGFPPLPRVGANLETTGSFVRNDSFGDFNANWDDSYWIDPKTGYAIAETYTEQDSNGRGDGFRWRELATVTSAQFPISYDWLALLSVYAGPPSVAVVGLVSLRWYHRGPRHVSLPGVSGPVRVTVRRARHPSGYLGFSPATSSPYGPFLPLILRRGRQRKNPVWVATDGQRLVGAMVRDREANVSSLFTMDPRLATLFRSMNRSRNFFSEVPAGNWNPKAQAVDTFQLLELSPVAAFPESASSVRALQATDLPEVLQMAKDVYSIPDPKWLQQAYEDGDLGFTAWNENVLVGFAFASVSGDAAILHTLTVTPAWRGRGFGRALMAARLNALAALGIQRAFVDISVRNPGSLAVARKFGFTKVTETTYYSRRPKRAVPADRRPF